MVAIVPQQSVALKTENNAVNNVIPEVTVHCTVSISTSPVASR